PDSKGLAGDPLLVIRELAQKVADSKIKKIVGRVMIDASLFPEGERELGTDVVLSPIVINDNLIDVIATPGASEGAPVTIKSSPQTSYVTFVNQATTGKAGSPATYNYADKANTDGTHVATITGTLPLGGPAGMAAYRIPEPKRFATIALLEALKEKGITCANPAPTDAPDFKALAVNYKAENLVAEHVSPPLKEEVKVTLKVSQNLHASITPSILGAVLSHADKDIDQAGFDLENGFLKKLGLDLTGAVQSDGAGGNAYYTPDFVVRYLLAMSKQKDFQDFYRALPVLGKDGTLVKIQVQSPAAGHVHAKTGTYNVYDALNKKLMVTGKGLAGYMDTASGEHLILALYANMVAVPLEDPEATQKIVGQALGEIAAAAYDLPRGAVENSTPDAPAADEFDAIIRNGKIIDGSGGPWAWGDIGIRGDRIAAIGKLDGAHARREIDAKGLVVAPGFIDMLGQSEQALLIDNRSLSKLSQGITSEITGEGGSIAPQNEKTLVELKPALEHYNITVDWTTLDGYYKRLQRQGTPLNIGTYVGAAQVREAVLGDVDRKPNREELEQMKALV
ncbi:MAG: D-alanyl-D-alanine carboxypeptidase, partial [Candidatus Acidiferrum sp.]